MVAMGTGEGAMRYLLLIALFTGCAGWDPFGGQDIGGMNDVPTDLAEADSECLDADPGRTLIASGGDGTVDVTHVGIVGQCCAVWDVTAGYSDDTIEVTYADIADEDCDCECWWTLDYTLSDVPAGAYTLDAEGDEVAVTVQ